MNDNKYIKHFNTCFDILRGNGRIEYLTPVKSVQEEPKEKKSFFGFSKKKVEEPVKESQEFSSSKDELSSKFKEEMDQFLKEEFEPHPHSTNPDKNIVRTFEQMWDFAQFVRYAEKTIFYQNVPEHSFYVDSPLDADEERMFAITTRKEITIVFKLKWVYDTTQKQTLKVINIKVTRDFGKNMINEYTIVNGEVKLKDDSDYTLIAVINDLLYDHTLNTYRCIMYDLLDFFEERTTYKCHV